MVGGQVFNKPVLMKQANQDKWVSNYEAWQLKITRFTVRQIGGLIGWLNVLQLTNFISYLATNLVDPFLAWVTGVTQLNAYTCWYACLKCMSAHILTSCSRCSTVTVLVVKRVLRSMLATSVSLVQLLIKLMTDL